MRDIIIDFLQASHIDPLYLVTGVLDIVSIYLWTRLGLALSNSQRALYKAIIVVSFMLSAGVLCKYFGVIREWRDLLTVWNS